MRENTGVIVDTLRTPFARAAIPDSGRAPGMYSDVHPVQLTVPLINEKLQRTGLKPTDVNEVLTGAVHQEYSQGLNIARLNMISEECGLPDKAAGTSVDMFCASSMETVAMADAFIARNPGDVYICTDVQSMSQIPRGGFNVVMPPEVHEGNAAGFLDMGITAENLAECYGIDRREQDAFGKAVVVQPVIEQIKQAAKNGLINGRNPQEALQNGIISRDDAEALKEAQTAANRVIRVDDFPPESFANSTTRPGFAPR